jgi:hypothetical protein
MSAAEALKAARDAGVRLGVDGDALTLKRCLASPSSPIARILDQPGLFLPRREIEGQRDLTSDRR